MVITLQLGLVLLSDGPGVDDGDIACQLTNSPCSPPPGALCPRRLPLPCPLCVSLSLVPINYNLWLYLLIGLLLLLFHSSNILVDTLSFFPPIYQHRHFSFL